MSLTPFRPQIAEDVQRDIEASIRSIEETEHVRILFAIESGSRAWGFPSPDSDYDVRFVYAREPEWYVSLEPGRDVIELPIVDELDINGWDIQKALQLLLKPNPTLLEWLTSPIRYAWNESACDKLLEFAETIAHAKACTHHYWRLGERLWKTQIEGRETVKIKRYFYLLRPAMALRWLRMHPEKAPPMNFQAMISGIDLPTTLLSELDALIERKAQTKELGNAAPIPALDELIVEELERAKDRLPSLEPENLKHVEQGNALFRTLIGFPND